MQAARELGVRIVASRGLDGSRRVGRRASAGLVGRADRRGARRDGAAGRAPGRRRTGTARGRALLAVLGDEGADGRVGGAGPPARAEAAHSPGRDRRGGRVLSGAVRLPAGRVPGRARLGGRGRLVRSLRPPVGGGRRLVRPRLGRGGALPDLEPSAWGGGGAGARAGRRRCAGRSRRRRLGLERAQRPVPRGEAGAAGRARTRRPPRFPAGRRRLCRRRLQPERDDRARGAAAGDTRRRRRARPRRHRAARAGEAGGPRGLADRRTRARRRRDRPGRGAGAVGAASGRSALRRGRGGRPRRPPRPRGRGRDRPRAPPPVATGSRDVCHPVSETWHAPRVQFSSTRRPTGKMRR